MKNFKIKIILAIIFLAFATGIFDAGKYFPAGRAQAAGTAGHPSLFFTDADLPNLKSKVALPGSFSKNAFDNLFTGTSVYDHSFDTECKSWNLSNVDKWAHELMEVSLKYALTDNNTYASRAISGINSMVDNIDPATFVPCNLHPNSVGLIIHGDYAWPVAIAYDATYDYMSSAQRLKTLKWLEGMAHWYWKYLGNGTKSTHNWYVNGWTSLALTSYAIYNDTSDNLIKTTYLNTARSKVNSWFNNYYNPSGYPVEGAGYSKIGGEAAFLFAIARSVNADSDILRGTNAYNLPFYEGYARLAHGELPRYADGIWDSNVRRMSTFSLIPIFDKNDPTWKFFFDHSSPDIKDYLLGGSYHPKFFTILFYPEDIIRKNPHDQGMPDSFYFKDYSGKGGGVAVRSGWDINGYGQNTATAWFYNKYNNKNHEHYDMNTFELSAYGERFIVDELMEGYDDANHGTSLEHNVIIVDDKSMPGTQVGTGGTESDGSALGRIEGYTSGDGGTIFRGDARYPYIDRTLLAQSLGIGISGVTEAVVDSNGGPFLKADRNFVLINGGANPPYFVVVDEIRKDSLNHKYEYRLHTKLPATGSGTINSPFIFDGALADLYITFVQPESFTGTLGVYKGSKASNNMISAVENNTSTGRFFSILYPKKTSQSLPSISRTSPTNGTAVKVSWSGGGSDYLLEKRNGASISSSNVVSDGKLATVRTSGSGNAESFMLLEGSSLIYNNTDLIKLTGGTGSVSASAGGTVASLDGNNISGAVIYTTGAKYLLVNGVITDFSRNGNYIVYGSASLAAPPAVPAGFSVK